MRHTKALILMLIVIASGGGAAAGAEGPSPAPSGGGSSSGAKVKQEVSVKGMFDDLPEDPFADIFEEKPNPNRETSPCIIFPNNPATVACELHPQVCCTTNDKWDISKECLSYWQNCAKERKRWSREAK